MPLSAGAVFGYFGVFLGVSTISAEPVNILSWDYVQVCLVLLWQLLNQVKIFRSIVLFAGSHFGGIFEPILAKNIEIFSRNRGI